MPRLELNGSYFSMELFRLSSAFAFINVHVVPNLCQKFFSKVALRCFIDAIFASITFTLYCASTFMANSIHGFFFLFDF